MARYGINVADLFGVSICELRKVARRLGTDHDLVLALRETGHHEAPLLACFVDDPAAVTEQQVEAWARDFDSWDLCDQATTPPCPGRIGKPTHRRVCSNSPGAQGPRAFTRVRPQVSGRLEP